MDATPLSLLLADDDLDDCLLFRDALDDLPEATMLKTVNDGVQLMQLLSRNDELPDALYLDLNMPLKNGFECLTEIKRDDKLKQLPVIIFSTSLNTEVVNLLHELGANYYIRKPAEFHHLKKILLKSIHLIHDEGTQQPVKDKFVITEI